ncbi:conserved hypothetical protein [Leishmania braziliensis MHOM/BR/75/M2904]|uniref:Palmitoyltransferase n=2 Tax=Leishmania braziliensis TaxID=5660 RepID=A4H754_LEIBR|nr:conserved hypothetical protein [Leishmania braziliensis MHOM/BR/75/M2904]KAI5688657.1 DHHC palmitoyltransferase [Leishmania braziliensis]CAJ2468659.1 unnamed protein product [Leishmania braziliensis]CAJ2469196.1 unnamed protein product [Leishmania braziliensis]CAM45610.1 conserved hypothetical protein [Leishmania braziliensis MHOM/BR/75/M2904]SYZ63868.1 palmitoyl_acyltransferase_6 [Leishmania braziliensis MHOM/BR/75/M2904]
MTVSELPATSNPGLLNYMTRALLAGGFIFIVTFLMLVHFYYATAALLDLVALLILFLFLASFCLSISSLVMLTLVGPGELPSRFSAARMETFIREELQRAVAKARSGCGGDKAATTAGPAREGAANGCNKNDGVTEKAMTKERKWSDVDEADSQQLANVATAAAILQRSSHAAEQEVLEQAAAEARLRIYAEDSDSASHHSDGGTAAEECEVQRGGQSNDADSEENAAEDHSELPAYMTEAMQMRRQRKVRRGLEIVLVSQAACKVLEAIDGTDMDRKQEEMSFLIPGANWCRFCNFYQMNDTRHCKVCDRCVYRSKLHCICCGRCIGYANSKYYVLFLFYLCLSLVMADVLDLYCVSWGYTYFFKPSGDANSVFYLVFVYSASFVVVGLGLLIQYLYAAGRGVGFLTDVLRQQRDELQATRIHNNGEQYQPILSERAVHVAEEGSASPMEEASPFSWRTAMETVGEGLPLYLWFWPTPTLPVVKETDDPPGFWDAFKEAIRLRLRSVADEDDVFSDEDELGNGEAADALSPSASVPSTANIAHVASSPPAASPMIPLAARVPYHAKGTDVTAEVFRATAPTVPRAAAPAYVNPSVPPTAKVASVPKHGAD